MRAGATLGVWLHGHPAGHCKGLGDQVWPRPGCAPRRGHPPGGNAGPRDYQIGHAFERVLDRELVLPDRPLGNFRLFTARVSVSLPKNHRIRPPNRNPAENGRQLGPPENWPSRVPSTEDVI